jgi:hypothetical protein
MRSNSTIPTPEYFSKRFGLRTLLYLILAIGCAMGWPIPEALRQGIAVA